MVSLPKHWLNVPLTHFLRGEDGLSELAEQLEAVARERPGGKFGKREAAYLPQSPFPPTLWRPSCGRCRFWGEGEPGEPGHCHLVGREGDPFGGEAIHYRGWCGLWMPPAEEPAFAWFRERLRPDGKAAVRGEYDPQMRAKEERRKARVERPTKTTARGATVRADGDPRKDEGATGGNGATDGDGATGGNGATDGDGATGGNGATDGE